MADSKRSPEQDEVALALFGILFVSIVATIVGIAALIPRLIKELIEIAGILGRHGRDPRIMRLGLALLVALGISFVIALNGDIEVLGWGGAILALLVYLICVQDIGRKLDPAPSPPPPVLAPPVGELDSYLEPFEGVPVMAPMPSLWEQAASPFVWSVSPTTSSSSPQQSSPNA